jgi:PAT family beta-lactamase induction signal transducer AmpG
MMVTNVNFALLSSFAAVGRTWLSAPAGYAAEALGWVGFYLLTTLVALPGLLLLLLLWRRGFVVETVRQT